VSPFNVKVLLVGLGGALDGLRASTEPGIRPTVAVTAIELMNALLDSACRAWRVANSVEVGMFLGMFQCSGFIARMVCFPQRLMDMLTLD